MTDFASWEEVPWQLTAHTDEPGVFTEFSNDYQIHRTMIDPSVLPPGLERGQTAAQSALNLKAWVKAQFTAVAPGCEIPLINGNGYSDAAYQNMRFVQYVAILNRLSVFNWSAWCAENGHSAGRLLPISRTVDGTNNEANTPQQVGPFVIVSTL